MAGALMAKRATMAPAGRSPLPEHFEDGAARRVGEGSDALHALIIHHLLN
jgi:hypothetical protein